VPVSLPSMLAERFLTPLRRRMTKAVYTLRPGDDAVLDRHEGTPVHVRITRIWLEGGIGSLAEIVVATGSGDGRYAAGMPLVRPAVALLPVDALCYISTAQAREQMLINYQIGESA
jgi:hypothetical protein